jgi:hypothetical protein
MKTQRFVALFIFILIAGLAIKQLASPADNKPVKTVQVLFVQNAAGLTFADGKLTLRDIDPLTVCFSDRPERLAGHMPTKDLVPMWGEGKDSFLKDPPNATLSMLQGRDVGSAVVTLRNPQLSGKDLTYEVTVLEGKIPSTSEACSLFIDIIGCPLTPMSYAGVARRTAWRGGYWGGGYYGPALYNTSGSAKHRHRYTHHGR